MTNDLDLFTKRLFFYFSNNCLETTKPSLYALESGKRLRPLLLFAVAKCLKVPQEKTLDIAVALELIHTYSLIHDDLPCMDNDDYRRNKPSLHKAFPEWLALLTGDALLTKAFSILANSKELTSFEKCALISILSEKSGESGMIEGQALDLLSKQKELKKPELLTIEEKKTGELFLASVESACILSSTSEENKEHLRSFGKAFGIAYQIADDIEDGDLFEKTSSAEKLEKQIDIAKTHLERLSSPSDPIMNFLHSIFPSYI